MPPQYSRESRGSASHPTPMVAAKAPSGHDRRPPLPDRQVIHDEVRRHEFYPGRQTGTQAPEGCARPTGVVAQDQQQQHQIDLPIEQRGAYRFDEHEADRQQCRDPHDGAS